MRHVISVSLSEDTILKLRENLRQNSIFRNKSHFIEYAINNVLGKNDKR